MIKLVAAGWALLMSCSASAQSTGQQVDMRYVKGISISTGPGAVDNGTIRFVMASTSITVRCTDINGALISCGGGAASAAAVQETSVSVDSTTAQNPTHVAVDKTLSISASSAVPVGISSTLSVAASSALPVAQGGPFGISNTTFSITNSSVNVGGSTVTVVPEVGAIFPMSQSGGIHVSVDGSSGASAANPLWTVTQGTPTVSIIQGGGLHFSMDGSSGTQTNPIWTVGQGTHTVFAYAMSTTPVTGADLVAISSNASLATLQLLSISSNGAIGTINLTAVSSNSAVQTQYLLAISSTLAAMFGGAPVIVQSTIAAPVYLSSATLVSQPDGTYALPVQDKVLRNSLDQALIYLKAMDDKMFLMLDAFGRSKDVQEVK